VNELSVEPKVAGPYIFDTARDAKAFVETSLLALEILGCEIGSGS
jgi:hypothetical protein